MAISSPGRRTPVASGWLKLPRTTHCRRTGHKVSDAPWLREKPPRDRTCRCHPTKAGRATPVLVRNASSEAGAGRQSAAIASGSSDKSFGQRARVQQFACVRANRACCAGRQTPVSRAKKPRIVRARPRKAETILQRPPAASAHFGRQARGPTSRNRQPLRALPQVRLRDAPEPSRHPGWPCPSTPPAND